MATAVLPETYESPEGSRYPGDVARTQLLSIEKTRAKLGERVDLAQEQELHTVVTRHGEIAACLVDVDWYRRARAALADPTDL